MKSERSFIHQIIEAIQRGLSPKPRQQCRTCGGWYRPSQLDREGFCQECNEWGA